MQKAKITLLKYISKGDDSKKFLSLCKGLFQYYSDEETMREHHADCIEAMHSYGRKDLLVEFVDYLIRENADENFYPSKSYILTLPLSNDVVKWYASVISISFYFAADGLVNVLDESEIWRACNALDLIFERDIPADNIRVLLKKLKVIDVEEENDTDIEGGKEVDTNEFLIDYLLALHREVNQQLAKKPSWLIQVPDIPTNDFLHSKLPKNVDVGYKSGSIEDDVERMLLRFDFEESDEKEEDVRERFLIAFSSMTNDKRKKIINRSEKNFAESALRQDKRLIAILGPCHPLTGSYDLNTSSKDICLRYGGCRMLTCYENENVARDRLQDEYDSEDEAGVLIPDVVEKERFAELEWFDGKCQHLPCSKKIRAKHHALRMPLETGGWRGCYCSFDCIVDDIIGDNIVRLDLVGRMREQIEDVGIYDRTW